MKILILVGSADTGSHCSGLAKAVQTGLQALSAEVEVLDLAEYRLPLYYRAVERANEYDNKTKEFLQKSYEADAFVWITPIYHNSFSAILKNALDWQHTKFPGKVVGLASNGGNRSPQAVDQLMTVARAQHLLCARIRLCTDGVDYVDGNQIIDPDLLGRVQNFCAEIVDLTARMAKA